MKHKIALFDRRHGNPTTPTSTRIPWRARRRGKEEHRRASSQSEFNSIRINTADYPIDLLRQYGDERANASSASHQTTERDQRPPSNTNELERYHSEERDSRLRQNLRRRPGECLFLTSGFRVNPTGSLNAKDILSATKSVNDGDDDGLFPFPEQSREGFFLRGKGFLLILFIILTLATVVGISWYYSCHNNLNKGSVHALVTANPVAKWLGVASIMEDTSDAGHMWINHVVKSDDNQILIAETIESRLNAEISPLLEAYVDKIWDNTSSPPVMCRGEDRLMVAFSVAKAGSMPASVTYETPCMNGPSSKSCVVKKQIADVRDLIVRLPSKSSRYMHAIRLEVDHSSKENVRNNSDVPRIQDLGTVSGHFRVELSDASRLALQRYCGQNRKSYSEDLRTEPVSARNTRLINVYELKRLYGLLSSQSDLSASGSNAWDIRMLSTVVVDPLDHSRHSMAPIHIQQLLSRFRTEGASDSLHGIEGSRSSSITVSSPQENDLFRHSTKLSSQLPTKDEYPLQTASSPISQSGLSLSPSSSNSQPSAPSPTQMDPTQHIPSFNFQPPAPLTSDTEQKLSQQKLPLPFHENSPAVQLQRTSADDTQFSATNEENVHDTEKEISDHTMGIDTDNVPASNQESSVVQDNTTSDDTIKGNSRQTAPGQGGYNHNTASKVSTSQQRQDPATSSERSASSPANKSAENPPFVGTEGLTTHRSLRGDSPATALTSQAAPANDAPSAWTPSMLSQPLPSSDMSNIEQGTPSASQLTTPTSALSRTLRVGPKGSDNGLAARPVTSPQIVHTETATTRGATVHGPTNIAHGLTKPNSVIQAPTQRSLSSPEELSSPFVKEGLVLDQKSSMSQAVSSGGTEISRAQQLSLPVKRSSTSSAGVISPTLRTSSPTFARSPSAQGSSSRAQRTSRSVQGSRTSAGDAPTPTRGVSRGIDNGLLAAQKVRSSNQRNTLQRGTQPHRILPRRVVKTQMMSYQRKQPDEATRVAQGASRTKSTATNKPVSVLGVLDSRFHPRELNQMSKPAAPLRIP